MLIKNCGLVNSVKTGAPLVRLIDLEVLSDLLTTVTGRIQGTELDYVLQLNIQLQYLLSTVPSLFKFWFSYPILIVYTNII